MIPKEPIQAFDWANLSWDENSESRGLTVPITGLQKLLDYVVELSGMEQALRNNVKITIENSMDRKLPSRLRRKHPTPKVKR